MRPAKRNLKGKSLNPIGAYNISFEVSTKVDKLSKDFIKTIGPAQSRNAIFHFKHFLIIAEQFKLLMGKTPPSTFDYATDWVADTELAIQEILNDLNKTPEMIHNRELMRDTYTFVDRAYNRYEYHRNDVMSDADKVSAILDDFIQPWLIEMDVHLAKALGNLYLYDPDFDENPKLALMIDKK